MDARNICGNIAYTRTSLKNNYEPISYISFGKAKNLVSQLALSMSEDLGAWITALEAQNIMTVNNQYLEAYPVIVSC
jgi:hypothetical protein